MNVRILHTNGVAEKDEFDESGQGEFASDRINVIQA